MSDEQMSPGQTMAALTVLWLCALWQGIDLGVVIGFSALWTYFGCVLAWRRWRLRRSVHAIRRLTRENRIRVLAAFGSDPVRVFLELELRGHGEPEVGGPVERFRVSPVDQRELEWAAYIVLGLGVLGATLPLTIDPPITVRAMFWVMSGGAAIASWWLVARSRWYRQSYELSAFGLKAVAPDSEPRVLRWSDGVSVNDRPRLNRIEFRSVDGHVSISIPYRVVGFERLIEALIGHLGLRPEDQGVT